MVGKLAALAIAHREAAGRAPLSAEQRCALDALVLRILSDLTTEPSHVDIHRKTEAIRASQGGNANKSTSESVFTSLKVGYQQEAEQRATRQEIETIEQQARAIRGKFA